MEAIATLKRNTRRFAKRQLTWFNKDPRINWIKTDGDGLLQTVDEIGALVAGKFNLVENNDSK
jgi:tRNA dimethylallyltransferase